MATQPAPTTPPGTPTPPTAWQMSPPPAGEASGVNPMATHVKVVAVLTIVWGALAALAALVFLLITGIAGAATRAGGAPAFVPGIIASLGLFFVLIAAVLAVLALLGGVKLLNHKRSGRTITMVVAVLALLNIPLGTAYGIYALVILTREDTNRLLVD